MTSSPAFSQPLLFVTVGTDYHPFDRLMRWIDEWATAQPRKETARCLVQCGTSRPPTSAEYRRYLGFDEIEQMLANASVVVSHGGPATIMLCHYYGLRPVVVPRRREYGEHVDNHQVDFCASPRLREVIDVADTESEFLSALDRRDFSPPPMPRQRFAPPYVAEAVRRFAHLVSPLLNEDR